MEISKEAFLQLEKIINEFKTPELNLDNPDIQHPKIKGSLFFKEIQNQRDIRFFKSYQFV